MEMDLYQNQKDLIMDLMIVIVLVLVNIQKENYLFNMMFLKACLLKDYIIIKLIILFFLKKLLLDLVIIILNFIMKLMLIKILFSSAGKEG